MFHERIKELFDALGASNQEIARCANCTPSTISRLRSGARKPAPHSPTVDKLIDGTIHYATLHGHADKLLKLVGVDDEELLDSGIRRWLYAESDKYTDDTNKESGVTGAAPSFSERLNAVMLLCDISNIRLARLVNIDTSYVSRFRNGIRSPKSNPELLDRICAALFEQIAAKELLPDLAGLINVPVTSLYDTDANINTDELYLHFHTWMDDFSSSDHEAINHLLGTIDTFTPNFDKPIPPLSQIVSDDIINDDTCIYHGIAGLQKAVLRFLGNAAKEHYDELLLYSDQGMEWMVEDADYRARWAALMATCVRQGTHIKIIHNIDRDIDEMVEAVESWLPLYASGMIESYYNRRSCGARFRHTIFLCPDKACIASCHAAGTDDKSIYNYYTDPAYLEFLKDNYECLMRDSGPLATVMQGASKNEDDNSKPDDNYNNISLSITQNKVIVVKNSAPKLTITFTHPLMCNAFQAYIDRAKDEQE